MRWVHYIILVAIMFVITATVAAQDSSVLRDALTAESCQAACYLGIEPGVTTPNEIEAILNAANLNFTLISLEYPPPESENEQQLRSYRIAAEENDEKIFPFLDDGMVSIVFVGDKIDQVSIVGIDDLTVSDVLDAFGAPTYILDDVGMVDLLYVEERVAFHVVADQNSEAIYSTSLISPFVLSESFTKNKYISNLQPCTEPANLCNIATATPVPPTTNTGSDQDARTIRRE